MSTSFNSFRKSFHIGVGRTKEKGDIREEGDDESIDVDDAVGDAEIFDEMLASADTLMSFSKGGGTPHWCGMPR